MSIRAFIVRCAPLAAPLALVAGGEPARAQMAAPGEGMALRGFSAQPSAGDFAPTKAPLKFEPVGSPAGLSAAGAVSGGETTAGLTKPRVKKPNPTRPVKQLKRKLPALVPYPRAPGVTPRPGSGQAPRTDNPAPNFAVLPSPPPPRKLKVEANPYAPVGVRVGSIVLRPSLDVSGGYASNPASLNMNVKGSRFLREGFGLEAESDWGRHTFKAEVSGGYTRYFDVHDANRPDGKLAASLKLEATRDTSFLLEARGTLDSQRANAPGLTPLGTVGATVKGRPLIFSEGVSAGVTHMIGRASGTLRGSLDRTDYMDANLSDGTKLNLHGQSFTAYGASARLGYEVKPGVTPFVEASLDARLHDVKVDPNGFKRDSTGATARAGASFEITRTLTGEAAVGYTRRHYDDARLKDLRGAIFDASLVWTASPLTTFTLKAASAVEETTVANASGTMNRTLRAEVRHALLRNLTVTGFLAYGRRDYSGVNLTEKTTSAGLAAEYSLSRSVVVRGSFTHDRLKSTAPNSDYTANVYLLGLKLQR